MNDDFFLFSRDNTMSIHISIKYFDVGGLFGHVYFPFLSVSVLFLTFFFLGGGSISLAPLPIPSLNLECMFPKNMRILLYSDNVIITPKL